MAMEFDKAEKELLAIAQGNIPHSLTPFADMARECGMEESEALTLLSQLVQSGAIRRFGASIRHQKAGWKHNAMVAWVATEAEAEACGPVAAKNSRISHIYFRPSPAADWPYTLYTMVHGRSDRECLDVVEQLAQSWPLKKHAILRSIRELKKTSMSYFG